MAHAFDMITDEFGVRLLFASWPNAWQVDIARPELRHTVHSGIRTRGGEGGYIVHAARVDSSVFAPQARVECVRDGYCALCPAHSSPTD